MWHKEYHNNSITTKQKEGTVKS